MKAKKIIPILLLTTLAGISLAACTSKKSNDKPIETSTSTSTTTQESTNESEGTFTAVIDGDVSQNETVDKSYRFLLKDVDSTDDPNDILPVMKNNGVVLNLEKSQLPADFKIEDYKDGQKVKFIIKGLAPMTASIPPQVAGNAVKSLEKN